MIAFSTVVGRACVDDAFRMKIQKVRDIYEKDADFNKSTEAMCTLVRDEGLRASLFEIWELVRVFSPNPKGWLHPNVKVDDRVDIWMRGIGQATANAAVPQQDPKQPNEVYEVIGVACVDKDFMDELLKSVNSFGTEPAKFDNFLARYNFPINSVKDVEAVKFLVAVFRSSDMVKNIRLFRDPQGAPISNSDTRCWDPPCEPNRVYTIDYNTSHPWGFPGRWRVPNET